MVLHYFKIATRFLLKNKQYTFINVAGLTVGMAAFLLIFFWIQDEYRYDDFHKNRNRVYELWNRGHFADKLSCWNVTPRVAATALRSDCPEVEKVCRVNWTQTSRLGAGTAKTDATGNVVDPEFLEVFTFPLRSGDLHTALREPGNIVITEKLAKRLFGTADAMGKTIRYNNEKDFIVTGIAADPPSNTRFNFEFLLPWSFMEPPGQAENNWGNNSTKNYVLVTAGASLDALQARVKGLRKKYEKDYDGDEMFLYPMERWRLYSTFENGVESGGRIETVSIFSIIAAIILLIACINFMNLGTARSEKRAREVGVRKTAGASRYALIFQFLAESVALSLISFVLALGIVQLSLPFFNELTAKQLAVDYASPYFWAGSLGFVLFAGVLAGWFPAFYLSSFKPVKVLKGLKRGGRSAITPRRVLVVLQFTFAVTLIICTLIIRQQIDYVQDRDAGYRRENLVYHYLSPDLERNYEKLKAELKAGNLVESISLSSSPLTQGWSNSTGFEWTGKDPNDKALIDRMVTDDQLVKTGGLKLVAGRDFDLQQFPTDSSGAIINETAMRHMGFKDPIGQIIKDGDMQFHVIGVVQDFILNSPYQQVIPIVIEGNSMHWISIINMRLHDATAAADIKKIETLYKTYNPEFVFDPVYVEDEYATKFAAEERMRTLALLFAVLTVLISCIGLYGLALYTAENRVKEIGIRKVLGASVASVVSLLSVSFLKLVAIALLIATPLAWYFMHNWLADYPYHVSISVWVFLLSGVLVIGIAMLTISVQAIRAAISNPVKSIRTE